MRVLDLACGPSTTSRPLALRASPGGVVIGFDLAPGMVYAKRSPSTPNVSFAVMDIESLAPSDASFDVAVCGHGFQLVPDLARSPAEARRVLRPVRTLSASVPATAFEEEATEAVRRKHHRVITTHKRTFVLRAAA